MTCPRVGSGSSHKEQYGSSSSHSKPHVPFNCGIVSVKRSDQSVPLELPLEKMFELTVSLSVK